MRVQKLKNHYSNKAAPGLDVAKKVVNLNMSFVIKYKIPVCR